MSQQQYLIQPDYLAERKADYKKGEKINKKWKPISQEEQYKICPKGVIGNVGSDIMVNPKNGKIVFVNFGERAKHKDKIYLFQVISAALAMYRVVCMINNPIIQAEGANGYKMPWSISLKHEETGNILMFGEWKGGFGIWTSFHKAEDLPASFKKDMVEILNLLFSDKAPHPYDGVTAGSVA